MQNFVKLILNYLISKQTKRVGFMMIDSWLADL